MLGFLNIPNSLINNALICPQLQVNNNNNKIEEVSTYSQQQVNNKEVEEPIRSNNSVEVGNVKNDYCYDVKVGEVIYDKLHVSELLEKQNQLSGNYDVVLKGPVINKKSTKVDFSQL